MPGTCRTLPAFRHLSAYRQRFIAMVTSDGLNTCIRPVVWPSGGPSLRNPQPLAQTDGPFNVDILLNLA
jgi:hypothetical protein